MEKRGGASLYSSFCCKISPEFGQPDKTEPEGHFHLDALQKICYFKKAQNRSAFMRRAVLGQIKRKSYVSSVVGLLPFGGLDQLCIAQAESVFQPSVCLLCQEWSFFIAFFNLRRRNNAIYRQKTDQQQHPARGGPHGL